MKTRDEILQKFAQLSNVVAGDSITEDSELNAILKNIEQREQEETIKQQKDIEFQKRLEPGFGERVPGTLGGSKDYIPGESKSIEDSGWDGIPTKKSAKDVAQNEPDRYFRDGFHTKPHLMDITKQLIINEIQEDIVAFIKKGRLERLLKDAPREFDVFRRLVIFLLKKYSDESSLFVFEKLAEDIERPWLLEALPALLEGAINKDPFLVLSSLETYNVPENSNVVSELKTQMEQDILGFIQKSWSLKNYEAGPLKQRVQELVSVKAKQDPIGTLLSKVYMYPVVRDILPNIFESILKGFGIKMYDLAELSKDIDEKLPSDELVSDFKELLFYLKKFHMGYYAGTLLSQDKQFGKLYEKPKRKRKKESEMSFSITKTAEEKFVEEARHTLGLAPDFNRDDMEDAFEAWQNTSPEEMQEMGLTTEKIETAYFILDQYLAGHETQKQSESLLKDIPNLQKALKYFGLTIDDMNYITLHKINELYSGKIGSAMSMRELIESKRDEQLKSNEPVDAAVQLIKRVYNIDAPLKADVLTVLEKVLSRISNILTEADDMKEALEAAYNKLNPQETVVVRPPISKRKPFAFKPVKIKDVGTPKVPPERQEKQVSPTLVSKKPYNLTDEDKKYNERIISEWKALREKMEKVRPELLGRFDEFMRDIHGRHVQRPKSPYTYGPKEVKDTLKWWSEQVDKTPPRTFPKEQFETVEDIGGEKIVTRALPNIVVDFITQKPEIFKNAETQENDWIIKGNWKQQRYPYEWYIWEFSLEPIVGGTEVYRATISMTKRGGATKEIYDKYIKVGTKKHGDERSRAKRQDAALQLAKDMSKFIESVLLADAEVSRDEDDLGTADRQRKQLFTLINRIEKLKTRTNKLKEEKQNLYNEFTDGKISEDDFNAAHKGIYEKEKQALEEIRKIQTRYDKRLKEEDLLRVELEQIEKNIEERKHKKTEQRKMLEERFKYHQDKQRQQRLQGLETELQKLKVGPAPSTANWVNDLVKLANDLDNDGLFEEANQLDEILNILMENKHV